MDSDYLAVTIVISNYNLTLNLYRRRNGKSVFEIKFPIVLRQRCYMLH